MAEQSFFERWSRVIKNTKLTERDPAWQKAIDYMINEGDLEPTMMQELSFAVMEDIVFRKGINGDDEEISTYELLIELGRWVERNTYDYLGSYFFNTGDVMLAYLMATQYALFWNGERWGSPRGS